MLLLMKILHFQNIKLILLPCIRSFSDSHNLADHMQMLCHAIQILSSSPFLPHYSLALPTISLTWINATVIFTVPEYSMLSVSLHLCLYCSLYVEGFSFPSFNLLPNVLLLHYPTHESFFLDSLCWCFPLSKQE